ncbi:MAG: MlaD family protein [Kiritimatiellae bacterium]|nr:MlaD family protein [Kiritimatiellia bacterium]
MRRNRMRELSMEVLVGTFMFVVLLSLCVFTIVLSRENVFKKTYPLEVVFADVMGLRDGDNVMMRGMIVGKVKAMLLQDEGVLVVAALQRPIHLKKDYSIDVVFSSVFGGRYMQISEGNPALEPLAPDTVVKGQTPNDVMALVSDVAVDLKDITGKINSGQGTLGKLVNDDTLYNDTRDVVNELKAAVKDRGLIKNVEASMANLNEITDKINHGEGTLGLLVNDESLYLEVKQMIGDIRATVDEMRETSPIVTFSSIFFGAF